MLQPGAEAANGHRQVTALGDPTLAAVSPSSAFVRVRVAVLRDRSAESRGEPR